MPVPSMRGQGPWQGVQVHSGLKGIALPHGPGAIVLYK